MWIDTACRALRDGKCLELSYDGFSRIVEVHAAGISNDNQAIMLAYQVRGGSKSNEPVGWKIMHLNEALNARLTDEDSNAPRRGYKRGHKAFRSFNCQL